MGSVHGAGLRMLHALSLRKPRNPIPVQTAAAAGRARPWSPVAPSPLQTLFSSCQPVLCFFFTEGTGQHWTSWVMLRVLKLRMPFPPLLAVGVSWHTLSLIPLSVRAVQGLWHRLGHCTLLWWLYTGACHSSCCLGALGGVTLRAPWSLAYLGCWLSVMTASSCPSVSGLSVCSVSTSYPSSKPG